jgi:hypothetical protein
LGLDDRSTTPTQGGEVMPELYDSSDEVDVRLNLLEHVGDDSVGETLTQDIIDAAAEIDSLRLQLLDSQSATDAAVAELVGLREQLARQAQICGERNGTHGTMVCNLPLDHDGDHCQRVAFASWAAVRALSVPAPPEAPEVTG